MGVNNAMNTAGMCDRFMRHSKMHRMRQMKILDLDDSGTLS